ncbi:MAG: ABC transporter permease [Clostridiales bacterium]|mgnify:FL=1|nr:ABC transporter permease [Clostridiales bacterium]
MNTFVNFLHAALLAGTPLMFGTLGEITTEKAGNLNLGVEGMMSIGAIAGFYVGFTTQNILLAVLGAFAAGILSSLIYAFLTVTLKANQNVTGLTLTIFGVGFSNFFGDFLRESAGVSVLKLSDRITNAVQAVHIPMLSDLPYVGKLFFQYNPFVYFGILLCIIMGIYINHTRKGLNLRAIGENPGAADAAGVNVTRVKYFNILLGGGICGIGGAYISLVLCGGVWVTNSVNGLGWIAVALVIFASWNPFKAILGSFIFGAFNILKFYIPKSIISIPEAIFDMLPFLVTAIVLIVTSIRKSKENTQPAGCGVNYFREER